MAADDDNDDRPDAKEDDPRTARVLDASVGVPMAPDAEDAPIRRAPADAEPPTADADAATKELVPLALLLLLLLLLLLPATLPLTDPLARAPDGEMAAEVEPMTGVGLMPDATPAADATGEILDLRLLRTDSVEAEAEAEAEAAAEATDEDRKRLNGVRLLLLLLLLLLLETTLAATLSTVSTCSPLLLAASPAGEPF